MSDCWTSVFVALALAGCCFGSATGPSVEAAAPIDARVVCWGSPAMYTAEPPHAVELMEGAEISGNGAVVCERTPASMRCFGNAAPIGIPLETGTPAPLTAVPGARSLAVGTLHACALLDGGAVQCWGANLVGQLGRGRAPDPTQTGRVDLATGEVQLPDVGDLSDDAPAAVIGLPPVVELVAGSSHTCARTAAGEVYCWGAGSRGQLGDGERRSSATPVQVAALSGAITLASSEDWSCALIGDGTVQCWGTPDAYPSGPPESDATPRAMAGFVGASAISMRQVSDSGSVQMLCAIDGSGHVLCANGTEAPAAIAGIEEAVVLSSGAHHTCALTRAGAVWCFGARARGQLGTSDPVDGARRIPQVAGAHGLASGRFFSCAVR